MSKYNSSPCYWNQIFSFWTLCNLFFIPLWNIPLTCFTSKDKHQMGIGFMFCAHNLTNITDLRNVTRTAKIYKAVFSLLASNAKKWVTLLLGVGEGVTWVNYEQ